MAKKSLVYEAIAASPNRRRFLQKIGFASAALTGAATLGKAQSGCGTTSPTATDIDVLNFALNLEYLEAEFYTVATTGLYLYQTNNSNFNGTAGAEGTNSGVHGGSQTTFSNTLVYTNQVAAELAKDEQQHVKLLRSILGGSAVSEPIIDLSAGGTYNMSTEAVFLTLSRAFEDVGVTAYGGAAPLLSCFALPTAARILATEAEHVGNIRLQIDRLQIPTTALDGADILPPPSGTQFFSTNTEGLTETRTPGQVLYIVYGSKANASSGGFFPSGVNGYFAMSSGPATAD